MADVALDASGAPQVFPGTMLKVEEGQSCAVLCAADDDPGSGSTTAAGCVPRRPSARPAVHNAKSPPSVAAAGLGARTAGGSSSGVCASPCPAGDPEGGCVGTDDDEGYEDDFVDGAKATAGDGSSSSGDETETFSELSDPGGTEVVYVREGVAVWPGARSERIPGRLSLVKQCNVLFMAWLPYSRGVLQPDGTFRVAAAEATAAEAATAAAARGSASGGTDNKNNHNNGAGRPTAAAAATRQLPPGSDRTLYAVHPIPLSEVRALRRVTPSLGLGCPSVVVVLTCGVTLPPLHFTKGGVKALIATLKQHVFLLKSADQPHTYLVNDTADPLSRSLAALQLADVLIGGPPPGASATFKPGEGRVAGAPAAGDGGDGASAAGAAAAAAAAPPPRAAAAAEWATPTAAVGLAAAAGLGREGGGGAAAAGRGRGGGLADAGGGLGMSLSLGLGLGSAVSWCWADQPPAAAAARTAPRERPTLATSGLTGFEALEEGGGGGGNGDSDSGVEDVAEGGGGGGGASAAARRQPNAWAYGIMDAINRFVQNVRGTASGWIGALDDLDEQDDELYDGDNFYGGPPYDTREPAPAERRRGDNPGSDGGGAAQPAPADTAAAAAVRAERFNDCVAGGSVAGGGAGGSRAAAAAAAAESSEVNTAVGDFELLDGGGCWGEAAAHPASRRRLRPPPLSAEELAAMFDAEGRLVGEAALRDRVCVSGCAPELRREVWKHLLGMYPRRSTAAQRADTVQRWQSEYRTLRQQWQSMVPAQEARCGSWRIHRGAVDKDVRRTDRGHPFFAREGGTGLRALRNVLLTHVVYDRDLGYCQGMSDLAAPLLVVMRDEAEAFWALAALLERCGSNFHSDLQGMNLQLGALRRLMQLLDPPLHAFFERRDCLSYYFAFRWLLICFKREFKFDEVLCLWEACWACRRTRHLHLYLAAAVLVQQRRVILSSPDLDFDGMLRLSIGLAGRLELQPLLETAEALVGYAGEAGREVTAWLP